MYPGKIPPFDTIVLDCEGARTQLIKSSRQLSVVSCQLPRKHNLDCLIWQIALASKQATASAPLVHNQMITLKWIEHGANEIHISNSSFLTVLQVLILALTPAR